MVTGHASVARRAPSLRRQAAFSLLHTGAGGPAVRADGAGTATVPCASSDALMVAATCAQGLAAQSTSKPVLCRSSDVLHAEPSLKTTQIT